MRKRVTMICVMVLLTIITYAQSTYTLSGYIKDSLSGETLISASVTVKGETKGVNSNQYGFFSLTLPKGRYTITASFIGYEATEVVIDLTKNVQFNFELSPRITQSAEVVISSKKRDANVKNAQMGKVELSMSTIKALPVIFGEVDILKTLQLIPGVRNAGEGNSGIYVRGGGPDQNLILLDDAVVYNPGHLFGFFSIFNGDAIKNVSLIKGGMPAQYGGRLSSVVDVAMKDGNMNKYHVESGLGLIASRLSVEGPIKKDKASFMVSARRTYIDALVKPFIPKTNNFSGSGYYFYDLNTKVNIKFSEKDRLYLSGYFGRDVFDFNNEKQSFKVGIPWGNSTATLRWNHVFGNKMFANTSLVYNDYKFDFNAAQNDFQLKLSSGIKDLNAKVDFDYYPIPLHKIKFGAQYTYHTFIPQVLSGNQDSTQFTPNNAQKKYANEVGLYVQDDWEINDDFKFNYGVRWSGFQQVGPYKKYTTDADGNNIDSTIYSKGEAVKNYGGLEPRVTLRYAINDESSFKAAVTRNYQYIHLVTNAGTTLPTDLWVSSTYRVKPQLSWQYAVGYFQNFKDNTFESSIELYYKTMANQIEYREGYTPSLKDTETDFVFGKGWSYGAELYLNKAKGRLTGWIGYTLSWTWRKFPDLNSGNKFPAKYDRRHDLSVVATYDLSKKWKLSGVFVYGTGNATTLPERFYVIEGVLTQEYSAVNQYRLKPYHRIDLAATYTPERKNKKPKRLKGSWVFSVYNAYSRANPYFIYFDQTGSPYDGTLKIQAKQVSLFPILPSVTWNFKW